MTRKLRPLLVLIGALIVAGGVFLFSSDLTVLTLTNLDRPRTFCFRLQPGERFSIFYVHSIYQQPVAEELEAGRDEIILRGIQTRDPGVMEYYGWDVTPGFHAVNRGLGRAFVIRMAMNPRQGLIIGGRKIDLREIGAGGDRIELRIMTASVGRRWGCILKSWWEIRG